MKETVTSDVQYCNENKCNDESAYLFWFNLLVFL